MDRTEGECRREGNGRPRPTGMSAPLVAITVDLHEGDVPSDITVAAKWLADAGVAATFLVPTSMLLQPRYIPHVRELGALGHEVGTHTHKHDWTEIHALIEGGPSRLGFMELSKRLFEDHLGRSPLAFRSAAWCPLGPAALDELQRLGYRVDSSATPQRLGLLSSCPGRGRWMRVARGPHLVRPGLLELPTSTILVPAASPAFLTFRRVLSAGLVRVLLAEARLFVDRVVVLQFHPSDFSPIPGAGASHSQITLRDFVLHREGGFGFKHFLRDTDPARITAMTQALIELSSSSRRVGLVEAARLILPEDPTWAACEGGTRETEPAMIPVPA